MFLDIQKIPAEGQRFDQVLKLPPLTAPGGETLRPEGVRLRGTATPGGRGVDLRAHLDAELTLTCGRCLDAVPFSLSTDVNLILVPELAEPEAGGEIEVTDDNAALFACPEGRADLGALATEQIYLALPLKALCTETCKGLCPQCGQNRNRVACDCRGDEIDPRLAPLLQFKKTRSGS
ncbi:MAG TPA: DUF177 domain-containing protein [Candidatus Polarisedimenticolaceae bacterium]|nr:DUF177 domain-containing protein [Candidatus Polarisedimenticolaceae bacterium]